MKTTYNLYNLVFCMVLLSISIQGTLLPRVAKRLSMIDPTADIRRTFNDYQEDSDILFIQLHIASKHPWCNQSLCQLQLPPDLLVAMIVRQETPLIPTGDTQLEPEDILVLAARSYDGSEQISLCEFVVEGNHRYVNRPLSQIPQVHTNRVLLIKRGIDTVIPTGSTMVRAGDILVLAQPVKPS